MLSHECIKIMDIKNGITQNQYHQKSTQTLENHSCSFWEHVKTKREEPGVRKLLTCVYNNIVRGIYFVQMFCKNMTFEISFSWWSCWTIWALKLWLFTAVVSFMIIQWRTMGVSFTTFTRILMQTVPILATSTT